MSSEAQILADDIRALSPHNPPESSGSSTGIVGYFLILFLAGGLGAPTGIAAIPKFVAVRDARSKESCSRRLMQESALRVRMIRL